MAGLRGKPKGYKFPLFATQPSGMSPGGPLQLVAILVHFFSHARKSAQSPGTSLSWVTPAFCPGCQVCWTQHKEQCKDHMGLFVDSTWGFGHGHNAVVGTGVLVNGVCSPPLCKLFSSRPSIASRRRHTTDEGAPFATARGT